MLPWRKRKTITDFSPRYSASNDPNPVSSSPLNPTLFTQFSNQVQASYYARPFAGSETTESSSHWHSSSGGFPAPEPPSPICSYDATPPETLSPKSDVFFSEKGAGFFCPSARSVSSTSCASKFSSFSDVFKTNIHETDTMKHHGDLRSCTGTSSVYESVLTEIDLDNHTNTPYSEKRCNHSRTQYNASQGISVGDGRHKLVSRPETYQAFLDEVKRRKDEAQKDTHNRAKQMKLMDSLRRRETAINDWETKEATKAMAKMKKLETKLERKRARALANTQQRIRDIKKAANRKKEKMRQAAEGKESTATKITKILGIKNLIWFKFCCQIFDRFS